MRGHARRNTATRRPFGAGGSVIVATWNLAVVYFVYGLAFFSMGLAVWLEGGRASDPRLRRALQPLVVFGFLHGGHEWLEMFQQLGQLPAGLNSGDSWEIFRLAIIVLSMIPLATFGALLFAFTDRLRNIARVTPLVLLGVWGLGVFGIRASAAPDTLWAMLNVWTRYSLGVPGALLAAGGLIMRDTTREYIHKQMAIVLFEKGRGEAISVATIQGEFSNKFQITGNFSAEDTTRLATLMRSSFLHLPMVNME